jgi:hypothetical protein
MFPQNGILEPPVLGGKKGGLKAPSLRETAPSTGGFKFLEVAARLSCHVSLIHSGRAIPPRSGPARRHNPGRFFLYGRASSASSPRQSLPIFLAGAFPFALSRPGRGLPIQPDRGFHFLWVIVDHIKIALAGCWFPVRRGRFILP